MEVFARFLNPILMVVFGLAAGVLTARLHRKDPWRFYMAGAWTFVLSQLLHLPFNRFVLGSAVQGAQQSGKILVVAILLGLSAGVFEEFARYIAYRYFLRDARRWRDALVFGAGHGGIEAILLGLLVLYAVLQLFVLRSPDAMVALGVTGLDEVARVQSQVTAFWALPWHAVLLGALERIFAICFHLSAAVLVLQVFRRRNVFWLFVAVVWHAVVDAVAVYASASWGVYWAEAAIGVLAVVSMMLIFVFRDNGEEFNQLGDKEVAGGVVFDIEKADLSDEQIDDSRYA